MRKHEGHYLKLGIALVFTLLVFLVGVLLGNHFTERKFAQVSSLEENLRIQTQGAELQYLLLLQDPCKFINGTPLTDELYLIGERLDFMESQQGERDPDVLHLKNAYSLLELRDWLYTLQTNKECGTGYFPIIYFYSNVGDCPKCQEQGYTLTYLRRKYADLRIYSFDIATKNPALDTVKLAYGVTATPTILLPNATLGFTSLDELETQLRAVGLA